MSVVNTHMSEILENKLMCLSRWEMDTLGYEGDRYYHTIIESSEIAVLFRINKYEKVDPTSMGGHYIRDKLDSGEFYCPADPDTSVAQIREDNASLYKKASITLIRSHDELLAYIEKNSITVY